MEISSSKKYKFFTFLPLICLIFVATLSPAFSADQRSYIIQDVNFYADDTKFSQDNLLVLQVNLAGLLILDEPIIGYVVDQKSFFSKQEKQILSSLKSLIGNDKQVFLSLKDFIRILELPVTFQKDNMRASGWFINEKNTFSIDLNKGRCVAGDRRLTIAQDNVVMFKDDIFVDIATLKKWFGLDVSFNIGEQEIMVNSGGTLPIEKRVDREQKWQKMEGDQKNELVNQSEEDPKELLQTPYKLASIPFGDLNYGQSYAKSKTASNSTSQLNAVFAGDFLYLNNQFFGTAQDNIVTGARLTSGRKDPDGKLLGIGATEFSLGDVYVPESALVSGSKSGKGVTISNYPLEYVNQFNKVTIRGNNQPNWDVEAYRNSSLINFQKVSSGGIYEFVDFPVVPGLNIVKLVFYGPFGQKHEEIRKFMVGNDLLKENKLYYRLAANKNNETLFVTPGQKSATKATNNKSDGVGNLFGELGYGVTKSTSIVTNLLQIPTDFSGTQGNYGGLSLRSSLLGVSGRFDVARDLTNKFNAEEVAIQTAISSYNLSTIFDRYDKEFVSNSHQSSTDPLYNQTTLRLDGPLNIPFMSLPSRISFTGVRQNYYSKEFTNNLESEIAFGLSSKVGLTENIKYTTDSKTKGDGNKIINGRTLLSYQFSSKLNIRSTLSYDIQPIEQLSSSDISSSYSFGNNLNLNLNASHQFPKDQQKSSNNYSSSVSKTFDKFIFSLGGDYSDAGMGSYGGNLNLSTSFGYDVKNNTGVISGAPIANGGAISARVFLDDNNNGEFDKGEKALEDVEVSVGAGGKKIKTNKKGMAFVTNIPPNNPSKIEVNSDSLPDPYLLVRKKAVKIIPHSGTITSIDFPVSQTGDISGYVFLDDNTNPTSNVEIELEDMVNKDVVYTAKSGYDGFYSLEMIPFGKYQLHISPKQAARLGFDSKYKHNLELNNDNQSISKVSIFVYYKVVPTWIKYQAGGINKNKKPRSIKYAIKTVGEMTQEIAEPDNLKNKYRMENFSDLDTENAISSSTKITVGEDNEMSPDAFGVAKEPEENLSASKLLKNPTDKPKTKSDKQKTQGKEIKLIPQPVVMVPNIAIPDDIAPEKTIGDLTKQKPRINKLKNLSEQNLGGTKNKITKQKPIKYKIKILDNAS